MGAGTWHVVGAEFAPGEGGKERMNERSARTNPLAHAPTFRHIRTHVCSDEFALSADTSIHKYRHMQDIHVYTPKQMGPGPELGVDLAATSQL